MNDYHRQTAYTREGLGGHALDWGCQPEPFKRYRQRQPIPLEPARPPGAAFLDLALAWPPPAHDPAGPLDAAGLAAALLLAAGITARAWDGPEAPGLRAAASAGALYPAELYVAACGITGLDDGLYHFCPAGPGLTPLWDGPLAAALGRMLGQTPSALTFALTAMYWRSLWKYRGRAYRYCLLDAGHMLANLELACAAWGHGQRTCLDFPDRSLNVFLGLASDDEAALALVQAGPRPAQPGPENPGLPPLDRQALPLSPRVGRDATVLMAHAAGDLEGPGGTRLWPSLRASAPPRPLPPPQNGGPGLLATVRARRSRRNFIPGGLDLAALSRLLTAALPAPGPCQATLLLGPGGEMPAGAYLHLPQERALALLKASDQRRDLAQACLGQLWVGQASMSLVLWADLELLEERGGPRTYRHAMLAAGRAGQRLYLAATALGLGCCGVGAFYDQEVAAIAGLPPTAQPLYVLACGPIKGGMR
ncbi:MAG: SagB/ThcOx family dehydrogenase [Desulfarculus sp.]|nr:SagB/ThcOx family dehydrogenase [Desulfarculus sp.]